MIAIVDYGVGNLFSLKSSLKAIGTDCVVTGDKDVLKNASGIILPGVGAFGDAIKKLRLNGLDETLKELVENGKPLLGICLGMQLLFDKSYEYGEHTGLGFIKGEVRSLEGKINGLKIPHMGWNSLKFTKNSKLLKYINDGDYVYFVHSFYADTEEKYLSSTAEYGFPVTASVENGNIFGTQFHPEKSGEVGLKILKAFVDLTGDLC